MKVSQSFRKYNVASFDIMNFHGLLLSFVVLSNVLTVYAVQLHS